VYFEAISPVLTSNRDFIHYRMYLCNKENPELVKKYGLYEKENKYYMTYARSIKPFDYPEREGIVRA
jgi:hypothetical protein